MLRPYSNPFSRCPVPVSPDRLGAFLAGRRAYHARLAIQGEATRAKVMEIVLGLDRIRVGDFSRIASQVGICRDRVSRIVAEYNGGPVFPSKGNARRGKKSAKKSGPAE
jgi:hypothetical protein